MVWLGTYGFNNSKMNLFTKNIPNLFFSQVKAIIVYLVHNYEYSQINNETTTNIYHSNTKLSAGTLLEKEVLYVHHNTMLWLCYFSVTSIRWLPATLLTEYRSTWDTCKDIQFSSYFWIWITRISKVCF